MLINQERLREILTAKHSYYGEISLRRDERWKPDWERLIAPQLLPTMRILDVGCGSGGFLLEQCAHYQSGLGIDVDPEFLQMAEADKRTQGVQNVEFLLLDFPREINRLQPESFDLLVSLRGPVAEDAECMQAAHRLLRSDGLLYCEEIAELHQNEKRAIFEPASLEQVTVSRATQVRQLFEQNGFEVRLTADIFTKWLYPDIYAWFAYECNLRSWLGMAMLSPDDQRISLFAEQNTNPAGEIVTTHHVAVVAGVKR